MNNQNNSSKISFRFILNLKLHYLIILSGFLSSGCSPETLPLVKGDLLRVTSRANNMHDLTATFESSDDENINAYYDKSFSVPLSDIDNLKVNRGTKRAFVTGALGGGSLGLIFGAIAPTAAGSAASFDRSFLILGGMLVGSVNDMKEESTFHLKIWIN